jgi:hypothetical protein
MFVLVIHWVIVNWCTIEIYSYNCHSVPLHRDRVGEIYASFIYLFILRSTFFGN